MTAQHGSRLPARSLERAGIVGAGRIGRALARAADAAGMAQVCMWSRSSEGALAVAAELGIGRRGSLGELIVDSDVVIIAVSDDAVLEVGCALAEAARSSSSKPSDAKLFVLTSGSRSLSDLDPLKVLGHDIVRMHPLQAITDLTMPAQLAGTRTACSASSAAALGRGVQLARDLGLEPIEIDESHAALWHAAATIAGNFPVTLLAIARDLASQTGMDERDALDAFGALARGAIDRAIDETPERSLTGPVVRGDVETIAAHVVVLRAHAPHLLDAYGSMVRATADLAVDAERLAAAKAGAIAEALTDMTHAKQVPA